MKSWFASRTGRRVLAGSLASLAALAAIGAVGVVAYPFFTNVRSTSMQESLQKSFTSPAVKTAFTQGKLADGDPLSRIRIPSIGTNHLIVEGTSIRALNTGAGHYPGSPLPGEPGNVAIAGHRTMYGQPFNRLDQIRAGDKIYLTTPFATHTYEVIPSWRNQAIPFIVARNDWSVVDEKTPDRTLTLTTCNPKGKATNRLVAKAKWISTHPLSKAA